MVATASHTNSIKDEDITNHPDCWSEYIEQEISVWKDFHEYWLKQDIPILIVRFEDLVKEAYETMKVVMAFLIDEEDISYTYLDSLVSLALN